MITVNLVTHFGADPTDNKDDTWAFIKASMYIRNLWDINGVPYPIGTQPPINYNNQIVRLIIPGTSSPNDHYIIGRQIYLYDKINQSAMLYNGVSYYVPLNTPQSVTTVSSIPYNSIFTSVNTSSNTNQVVDPANTLGVTIPWVVPMSSTQNNPIHCHPYSLTLPVFSIINLPGSTNPVNGLYITNDPNNPSLIPRLKVKEGMDIGFTDDTGATVPKAFWDSNSADYTYNGGLSCFDFEGIKQLRMENIEIDGSTESHFFKGDGDPDPLIDLYQNGITGIDLCHSYYNAREISIINCLVHHCTVDGINVRGDVEASIPYPYSAIHLKKVKCYYNRRQGMTLESCKHCTFENCEFSHTNKAIGAGQPVSIGGPSAGVDIEAYQLNDFVDDITFDGCTFEDNNGGGVINNICAKIVSGQHYQFTKYLKFINYCKFINPGNIDFQMHVEFADPNLDGYALFEDCEFYGGLRGYGGGDQPSEMTIFRRCKFLQQDYIGGTVPSHVYGTFFPSDPVLGNGRPALFDECTFSVSHTNSSIAALASYHDGSLSQMPPNINESNFLQIKNCTFLFNNQYIQAVNGQLISFIRGAIFEGHNIFRSLNNVQHGIRLERCIIKGSDDPCNPSYFSVEGTTCLEMSPFHQSTNYPAFTHQFVLGRDNMNGTEGYSELHVGKDAMLNFYLYSDGEYVVGKNSKIIVDDGGTLASPINFASELKVHGEIVLHENSFVNLPSSSLSKNGNTNGLAEVFCHSTATWGIPSIWTSVGASPYHYTASSNSISINSNSPCFIGGNLSFSGLTPCSFAYNNISTSANFDILYNIHDVDCNGIANGYLQIQIQNNFGPNSPIYEYNIGNGWLSLTNNTIPNLTAQSYTVTIRDANNCPTQTNSFSFTITEPAALQFNSISINDILCNGGNNGSVTINVSGGIPVYQYKLNSGSYQNSSTFSNLIAGNYTITTMDANNCTLTTIVTVSEPTALSWLNTNFNNIPCGTTTGGSISVNAQNGTSPYQYNINGGAYGSSGNFNSLGTGNYTVNAKDDNGCTISTMFHLEVPTSSGHCACLAGQDWVNTQNIILLNNPNASGLTTLFGSTITNKKFYIDGTLTVDQNITFSGCTLLFTPTGNVVLNTGYEFEANNQSTLQGICGDWLGIVAAQAQNKVTINSSTVKDMFNGIQITNNAVIDAQHSHFINNLSRSILFNLMTTSNYTGIIEDNEFTSNSSMFPVQSTTLCHSIVGIEIQNCKYLVIGDVNGYGNTFSNLLSGVNIAASTNIATIIGSNSNTIEVNNGSFSHIENCLITGTYTEVQKVNNCYQNGMGAAVYVDYDGVLAGFTPYIKVQNEIGSSTSINYCDKGVVSVNCNVETKELNIDHTLMGIMNALPAGRIYTIDHNTISDAFIGIQIAGDHGNSQIINNEVSIVVNGISSGLYSQIWPKGIEVSHYSNTSNPNAIWLENNAVSLNGYSGTGISFQNTNEFTEAYKNYIYLNNTDPSMVCASSSNLTGIGMANAGGSLLEGNHIYGNTTIMNQPREDMAGILIDHSHDQYLHCNHTSLARFGIMGISQCLTGNEEVKGNTVDHAVMGWVFRHLGGEGTFGDVGSSTHDNGNTFTGNSFATAGKVFRFCEDDISDYIFTKSTILDYLESGSYNPSNPSNIYDCPYGVLPNAPSPYSCPSLMVPPTNNTGEITLPEALSIANDTKVYPEFDEVARWMDIRWLFDILDNDMVFRNSHSDLLNFYYAQGGGNIEQMQSADDKLREIIELISSGDTGDLGGTFGDAEDENEGIDITEIQSENEQRINAVYLNLLRFGRTALSDTDKIFVSELSLNCPYVAGSAVYKARNINNLLNPALIYDNIKLCNSVGQNKNSGTTTNHHTLVSDRFNRENETLRQVKSNPEKIELQQNDFVIYPNPASSYVNVRYKETDNSQLQIMDIVGRVVMVIQLPKENDQLIIRTDHLASGVYTYKQMQNKAVINSGKLTIE